MPSTTTNITLREPAPHHSTTLGFGRGGAGNRTKTTTTSTSHPAPPTSLPTTATSTSNHRPYHTGRGGAGNLRPSNTERRLFSFDEELQREEHWRTRLSTDAGARSGNSVPVYHIGRGGQGNMVQVAADGSVAPRSLTSRRGSQGGSSVGSSEGSEKKGVSGWVKGLSRRA